MTDITRRPGFCPEATWLVANHGRSELTIGYFTKYGDGGVDLLPIGIGVYARSNRCPRAPSASRNGIVSSANPAG